MLVTAVVAMSLLSGAPSNASAAELGADPGGRRATLRLEASRAGGRSLILQMNVISQPTTLLNLLDPTPTDAQRDAQQHQARVFETHAVDMEQYGRLAEAFGDACVADENSSACATAKARFDAFNANAERLREQGEAALAAGPQGDVDDHRFQMWGGDADRGCGIATIVEPSGSTSLTHQAGQGAEAAGFDICWSELVLDRKTGEAFLKIDPMSHLLPGGRLAPFNLEALERSGPDFKVDPGGNFSRPHAILRRLQPTGGADAFTAEGRLPARDGSPIIVRLEFRLAPA
ncbi:hypothetical protein [Brevundimonas sp. Root1423]|uniref:hypothetical protein n=1 Tax=Brevundimonas sp. Root1423 TaxID=1736462 RepID=UPI0006FBFCE3|nr:hypothetical protein [Brevundimonas sp. Root1423]KQY89834.1 hypothetical protein ASD25_04705 [Brevundimonas sp. Root1423]